MDFERRDEGDAFGFTYDDDKKVKKPRWFKEFYMISNKLSYFL